MDRFERSIELGQARIAQLVKELEGCSDTHPKHDELLSFVQLQGIAERMVTLDLVAMRLERAEAMVAFLLKNQVVEGRQRPTPAQMEQLGPQVTNFVTTTSLLQKFTAEWAELKAKEEKKDD